MDYVATEHYCAFEKKKALPNQLKVCWELPEEQLTWSWSIVESLVVCSHIVHFGPEPSQTDFLDTYIPDFVRSFARVFKVVLGFLATYLAKCLGLFCRWHTFFHSCQLLLYAGGPSLEFWVCLLHYPMTSRNAWIYTQITLFCCVSIANLFSSIFLLFLSLLHKWWEKVIWP